MKTTRWFNDAGIRRLRLVHRGHPAPATPSRHRACDRIGHVTEAGYPGGGAESRSADRGSVPPCPGGRRHRSKARVRAVRRASPTPSSPGRTATTAPGSAIARAPHVMASPSGFPEVSALAGRIRAESSGVWNWADAGTGPTGPPARRQARRGNRPRALAMVSAHQVVPAGCGARPPAARHPTKGVPAGLAPTPLPQSRTVRQEAGAGRSSHRPPRRRPHGGAGAGSARPHRPGCESRAA